jgi:hypothetical protein
MPSFSPASLALLTVVVASSVSSRSFAAVTEPNGVVVPIAGTDQTSLQAYLTSQGENIDAVMEAAAEPGAFSPLCDFTATLVLKQSQASCGIAWYNTTAGAVGPVPAAEVHIIANPALINQTITSAEIRSSPDYMGGLIGFGLYRDGGVAYWSEFRRNQMCTGCATPDYWKTMLVYPSTTLPNTFYLAFEDWPGAAAQPNTWHNDGDFNDQVFRVTGVACPGSGAACDTGMPGVCSPGLTECVAGATLRCVPLVPSSMEVCDGLDNDCDDTVDDGDLCSAGEVCDRGRCVAPCSEVMQNCTNTQVCSPEGYCVDAMCVDVTCPAGQRCSAGTCREPCQDVVCPAGQMCLAGRCADPCEDVTCMTGRVCDRGVCVPTCDCQICPSGKECATSGACVPTGCSSVTCPMGETCAAGQCVDSCTGARCPLGEKCEAGACVDACTGVDCPSGQKCAAGVCIDSCSDVHCRPGEICVPGADDIGDCVPGCTGITCGGGQMCTNGACPSCDGAVCEVMGYVCMNGTCVNPCTTVMCAMGEICRDGACADSCAGVNCPMGQACENGICVSTEPPPGGTSGMGGTSGASGAGATGGGGAGGVAAAGALGGADGENSVEGGKDYANPGCTCRLGSRARSVPGLVALAVALSALARRRRRAA